MKPEQVGQYVLRIAMIESLHMDRTRASNLASGVMKPSLDSAAAIEAATGVPASSWATGNPRLEMWKIMIDAECARRAGQPASSPVEPL